VVEIVTSQFLKHVTHKTSAFATKVLAAIAACPAYKNYMGKSAYQ
jgi:hypothetical protein